MKKNQDWLGVPFTHQFGFESTFVSFTTSEYYEYVFDPILPHVSIKTRIKIFNHPNFEAVLIYCIRIRFPRVGVTCTYDLLIYHQTLYQNDKWFDCFDLCLRSTWPCSWHFLYNCFLELMHYQYLLVSILKNIKHVELKINNFILDFNCVALNFIAFLRYFWGLTTTRRWFER